MEAKEALGVNPGTGLDGDPACLLEGCNYLDPNDPIDRLLADYKKGINDDTLQTAAEQRVLVAGLKNGDLDSTRTLVEGHSGLIAAVAYPFKAGRLDSGELLKRGVHAFIQAAKTYDAAAGIDFSDHSAAAIHRAFTGAEPDLAGNSFIELPQRPMEGVHQFMQTVWPARSQSSRQKERSAESKMEKLTPDEMKVLSHLHLDAADIALATGLDKAGGVDKLLAALKEKLGVDTREEAALMGLAHGIKYDVLEIPDRALFTLEERQVAMRLGKRNKFISEELGFSEYKVKELGTSLRAKTQARTRAEIALMAHMGDFEPTEEELNPLALPLSERLSPLQETVIHRVLYMQDKDIAAMPDIDLSESGVCSVVNDLIIAADLPHNNRTALILELHRQGIEFDVVRPDKPIAELLFRDEIEIAKLLHLPYEEVIERLDLDCTIERLGTIVHKARQKIGAHTRQELALAVEIFYDGSEALDRSDNNEWRLAQHLGLKTLAACDIETLMEAPTERQREIISSYYLADGAVTWPEVCVRLGIQVTSARKAAAIGISRMAQKLEEAEISG